MITLSLLFSLIACLTTPLNIAGHTYHRSTLQLSYHQPLKCPSTSHHNQWETRGQVAGGAEQSQLLQECVTVSEVEEFVPIMEEGVEAVEALETAEVMEEGAEAVEALEAEEVMVEGVGMVEAEVEEFEAILKEIPQTLNEAAQARHIPTGSGYKPGRSVLTADPEILLEGIHAGKYKIIRIINEHKVTVEFAEEIGYYYSKRKLPQATRYATIHYGAEGAHIVPANPNRKIP